MKLIWRVGPSKSRHAVYDIGFVAWHVARRTILEFILSIISGSFPYFVLLASYNTKLLTIVYI